LATTTTTRRSPNGIVRERVPSHAAPTAGVVRRRQVRWIVAGVLLVVGSALVFATIFTRAGSETRVLALTRSVDSGHVLVASDLRAANVSTGEGVATVRAASEASVVGRTVAVPLAAGSLLNPEALGSARALRDGDAMVGLALKPGTFPSSLAPGDHVRVVDTIAAASTSGTAAPARSEAAGATGVVMAIDANSSASDGSAVVSLRLQDDRADGVAQLASADHASLVLIPAGS
jgi:hypothetical protein